MTPTNKPAQDIEAKIEVVDKVLNITLTPSTQSAQAVLKMCEYCSAIPYAGEDGTLAISIDFGRRDG